MFRIFYLGCLLFLAIGFRPAYAQLAQALRLEIPSDPNEAEAFDVTPLAEDGVLMTVRTGNFVDHTPVKLSFRKYDTNLKLLWHTEFKQDVKYIQVSTYDSDRYVYHLFREYDTDQYQFVRLHLDDGVIETFEGNLIDQLDVQQFKVMGSQAYVSGYH
ncbi:MAG: hypothetical protein EOO39_42900, partial [Cytophagaceae bacterium]